MIFNLNVWEEKTIKISNKILDIVCAGEIVILFPPAVCHVAYILSYCHLFLMALMNALKCDNFIMFIPSSATTRLTESRVSGMAIIKP